MSLSSTVSGPQRSICATSLIGCLIDVLIQFLIRKTRTVLEDKKNCNQYIEVCNFGLKNSNVLSFQYIVFALKPNCNSFCL